MTVLEAVADPVRREIIELLRRSELDAGQIGARFDITQPAVSRHLRVLREAGLVRVRAAGQRRIYALDAAPLMELDRWLEPYREFWSQRLDVLDAHVQRARGRRKRGK